MNRIFLIFTTVLTIFVISGMTISQKGPYDVCRKNKDCNGAIGLRCLKGICQCNNPDVQIYSHALNACVIKIGRRCGTDDDDTNTTTTVGGGNATKTIAVTISNLAIDPTSACVENGECRKLKLRKWCRCKEGFMSNNEGTICHPVSRYGESCNGDSEFCDKRSGTVCIEGRCQCPFGEHQYFDQHDRRCISFARGNCSVPKISPCVKNAECINVQLRTGYTTEDGVKKVHSKSVTQCLCTNAFVETKSGYCMASAGMECSAQQICNSESFLVCIDGKCKCRNPLYETVDEDSGQCAKLVGSDCSNDGGLKCVKNSECIERKCQCSDGYSMSKNKTCSLGYKQSCTPNQCNISKGLACVNGLCECFDSHLVYDESTKACVGLSSSSD